MLNAAQSGAQQAIEIAFMACDSLPPSPAHGVNQCRALLAGSGSSRTVFVAVRACNCMSAPACVWARATNSWVVRWAWQPTSTIKGVTALVNVWAVNPCSAEGVAIAGCGRGCGAASATAACAEEAVANEGVAAEQPEAQEVQIQQSGAMGHPGVGPLRRPILRHVPGHKGLAHCFGPSCLWES